jgi:hypothetical protein
VFYLIFKQNKTNSFKSMEFSLLSCRIVFIYLSLIKKFNQNSTSLALSNQEMIKILLDKVCLLKMWLGYVWLELVIGNIRFSAEMSVSVWVSVLVLVWFKISVSAEIQDQNSTKNRNTKTLFHTIEKHFLEYLKKAFFH